MLLDGLANSLDANSRTGAAVLGWRGDAIADALALRLAGGLHALVRAGGSPALTALYPPRPMPDQARLVAAVRAVLADRTLDAWLLPWLDSAPQTNEVGRSAVLLPGLMVIAQAMAMPLRLFELGASGGLNLGLDRWHYRFGDVEWGRRDTAVRLAPLWNGPPPPLVELVIAERRGVDINPLDVTDPDTAARLLAYIWPDQSTRLGRAAAAIAATAAQPVAIDRADAADWLESRLALAPQQVSVVLHSIAFQYFPVATQARIAAQLAALGAAATPSTPLAWLRYEPDDPAASANPVLRLTLWSGGPPRESLLARAHPHGTRIEWL